MRSSLAALVAGALTIGGATGAAAQERITWTDQVNVAVRGIRSRRRADVTAAPTPARPPPSDRVEWRLRGVPGSRGLDVSRRRIGEPDARNPVQRHRVRHPVERKRLADVVESGKYVGGDMEYQAGDTFRIEVANDRVRYMRNGDVMATSRRPPTYPLAFDVGLGTVGASVANAEIGARGRASDVANINDSRNDFRRFDRNGDGVIARREWTGDRRWFDERDTNGDGRITRREHDAFNPDAFNPDDAFDDPGVAGTSGELIPVSALERWTDTGIVVRAGDSIIFEADGSIQMSGDRGDTADPAGSARTAPGALVRGARAGTYRADWQRCAIRGRRAADVAGAGQRTTLSWRQRRLSRRQRRGVRGDGDGGAAVEGGRRGSRGRRGAEANWRARRASPRCR